MDLIDFVKAVEFPAPSSLTSATRDASLSGGGATSFVQDVLDSTLFAQLAATKQHDRTQSPDEWYKVYQNTLETVGWIVTGFDFKEYQISNTEISVDKIVLEFLQSALAPPQLAVVMSMIDALRKRDEQDPAVRVFTNGNVLFSMGSFKYNTNSKITNALFTKLRRGSAHMFNSFQGMILNERVYASVRDIIADRIGDFAWEMIIDIPI